MLHDVELEGFMSFNMLPQYLSPMGRGRLCIFAFLVLGSQVAMLFIDNSLAQGSNEIALEHELHGERLRSSFWLLAYALLWCLSVVLGVLSNVAGASCSSSASKRVPQKLSMATLRTPLVGFFDREPLGQLISRFAADIYQIDLVLWIKTAGAYGQTGRLEGEQLAMMNGYIHSRFIAFSVGIR